MNADFPQNEREQLEAKLTALLLGELPANEAIEIGKAMEQDPKLAALYERLKATIGLVRESAVQPAAETAAQAQPLKLSSDRREKLLAQFKTVTPKEFAKPAPKVGLLLQFAAVLAILGLLAALLLPSLAKSKSRSMSASVMVNLRMLDGAKQQWALENSKSGDAAPTMEELKPYLGRGESGLPSVAGEAYVPGKVSEPAMVETSPAEAKKLIGRRAVTTTAVDNGKVQFSLLPPSPPAQPATQPSPVLVPASPITAAAPKTEIVLPSSDQQAIIYGGVTPSASPDNKFLARNSYVVPGQTLDAGALNNQTKGALNEWTIDTYNKPGNVDSDGSVQQGSAEGLQKNLTNSQLAFNFDDKLNSDVDPAKNESSGKVMLLGDIPTLGAAFQGEPSHRSDANGNAGVLMQRENQNTTIVLPAPLGTPTAHSTIVGNGGSVPSGGFGGGGGGIVWASKQARPVGGKQVEIAAAANPVRSPQPITPAVAPNHGELSTSSNRALGFDWYASNFSGTNGASPSSTDGLITGGLRRPVQMSEADARVTETRRGTAPSPSAVEAAKGAHESAIQTGQLVQDGKLLYQLGKLDEADSKMQEALNQDPNNQAALYYESLVKQVRQRQVVDARNVTSMNRMASVETGWGDNDARKKIPVPGDLQTDSNSTASTFDPSTGLPVATPPARGALETRTFKVDPNQFYDALRYPATISFGGNASVPKTQMPEGVFPTNGSPARGLRYVTGLDPTAEIQIAANNFFRSAGADLEANKGESLFFNDRQGTITIHGTPEDLAKAQAALDMLAVQKSDVTIAAKFAEVGQQDQKAAQTDTALPKPALPPPTPQPEILTRENAFSTFSLNVSDVSFKLAAASLEKGQMPDPGSIRSEEFINAFNYRDPDAGPGVPIAFASERARYPFAHNRELLRFSLKTAAGGRQAGRPLNIVLLLDNSGSMERADRVGIIQEALRVLAGQLQKGDMFSIVTFARTAQLRVNGVHGDQAAAAAAEIAKLTPEGGTNLGEALDLAYETALHHYLANGDNRVVLLTDGAANLGDVNPAVLKQKVEAHRKQGVALDCFGIGWEDYNDDLLEVLTRNGDGRYGFINKPEEASTEFVSQIAGALHVAAADVKVQVEFNPKRVTSYRQIGYAKHQLTKEQFRDNTVDAAEIAAQEAGNALYTIETNPQGEGSIATVRVRYKVPATGEYREEAWDVPYTGSPIAMDQASPAMRLASTASAFSEWLATSPFAAEVTTDQLLRYLNGVPKIYGADARPAKLESMIREARSISGK